MQNLSFNSVPVHRSRDWTPERRHRAEAHVGRFVLEFATDPALPNASARTLRALYPLHADQRMAVDLLRFATDHRWSSWRLRTAVRAFVRGGVLERCRGDRTCWIHDVPQRHRLPAAPVHRHYRQRAARRSD
jgi:hypothetical protein